MMRREDDGLRIREIRGSVRSGLKSICCSQKWHREYLVVIKDLISETFQGLKDNWM